MGGSGEWGGGRCLPHCAPSALTQIVPILASICTVFHSVIFNSVVVWNSVEVLNNYFTIANYSAKMYLY